MIIQLGRTPPSHTWYLGRNPGGSFRLMPRKYQTAFSRFVSGHIKALTFRQSQKIFLEYHKCYSELVSPAHILTCLDFKMTSCQVIYSQFGLAIHPNDHQARRRFVEWAQNEIAVVPDFHKRILFSDEAHFWLNGYFNKQNCRIWSEANPQVYVETPLHPEKLTVWCALWAGGILLQKR
ncbi:hypothetical protein TNCV_3973521 [Trichonephila clavipes]|nr:hypothetical protein TNCV_3973521 [Trichonephila clavipes]